MEYILKTIEQITQETGYNPVGNSCNGYLLVNDMVKLFDGHTKYVMEKCITDCDYYELRQVDNPHCDLRLSVYASKNGLSIKIG
jgi:hypothetical protein